MANLFQPYFQLNCKNCDEQLFLETFALRRTGLYAGINRFLKKHVGHELVFTEIIPEIKIRELTLGPHIDRSTPEKEQAWFRATKILVEALERNHKNQSSSQDEETD
jgi:hypothetical protein